MSDGTLARLFAEYDSEYLNFDDIENKLSGRPDLHAFILLDNIVPDNTKIIGCSQHDIIYLDVNLRDLEKDATKEHIVDLIRCGVRYSECDGLTMFV